MRAVGSLSILQMGDETMKMRELLEEAKKEVAEEIRNEAIGLIKERLYEIQETRKALSAMEKQLEDELGKDLDTD